MATDDVQELMRNFGLTKQQAESAVKSAPSQSKSYTAQDTYTSRERELRDRPNPSQDDGNILERFGGFLGDSAQRVPSDILNTLSQLQRPQGAVLGSIRGMEDRPVWQAPLGAAEGAVRGFRDPDDFGGGAESSLGQRVPEKYRGAAGFAIETLFDPIDLFTGGTVGTDLARLGRKGISALSDDAAQSAVRKVQGAVETSTRGILDNPARPFPGGISGGSVEAATEVNPARYLPPESAQRAYGLTPVDAGLSKTDEILNVIKRETSLGVPKDELVDPAFIARNQARTRADFNANRLGQVSRSTIRSSFQPDKQGRISALTGIDPSIPGAPTIQDIAARYPIYREVLTPEQRKTMDLLQRELDQYGVAIRDMGIDLGVREDIMDGGFYIPRGSNEDLRLADMPTPIGGSRRGKPGYRQEASFPSMAEALEVVQNGKPVYKYSDPWDAIESYVRNSGRDVSDAYVANYLRASGEAVEAVDGKLPRGTSAIMLRGLENTGFPAEMANAANSILMKEGPARGFGSSVVNVANAFNNLYRGVRATMDNSWIGIQGLLGLYDNPRATAGALKLNARSWLNHGDEVLGDFVVQFDEAAETTGRLTSQQWAAQGLPFTSGNNEFQVGRGLGAVGDKIRGLPGVRQADRAFGTGGDSQRLLWADAFLEGELSRGRSIQEIIASGDAEKIATGVGQMTGWAPGRAFGDVGEVLTFAPRFLQSRINTVVDAARGLAPGATIEQRMARRAVLKMIGTGVTTTVLINEALGNDTDFRPFVDKNGRPTYDPSKAEGKNPNLLRINWNGRDWSLFGTWDSFFGLVVGVGAGNVDDAIRSMGSGVTSLGLDLFTGENFEGDPTRDNATDVARTIAESMVPFSSEGVIGGATTAVRGATQQDYRDVASGLSGAAAEFGGIKATERTPFEQERDIRSDIVERNLEEIERERGIDLDLSSQLFDTPVTPYEQLQALVGDAVAQSITDQYAVDAEKERLSTLSEDRLENLEARAMRGDDEAQWKLIGPRAMQNIDDAAALFRDGTYDGEQFRNAVNDAKAIARADREKPENQKYADFESNTQIGKDTNRYFEYVFDGAKEIAEEGTPEYYDAIDKLESEFIDQVGEERYLTIQENIFTPRGEVSPEYKQLQQTRLLLDRTGFYDIRDEAWGALQKKAPYLNQYETEDDFREAYRSVLEEKARGATSRLNISEDALQQLIDNKLGSNQVLRAMGTMVNMLETQWVEANSTPIEALGGEILADLAARYGYMSVAGSQIPAFIR